MKTVLITGASRGIGRATACLAGARGWSVGINYVAREDAARETAQAVQDAGGQAEPLQGDMTVEADIVAMFNAMEARFGPLDGLVVNAGIVAPSLPLADMSAERLRRVFDLNILGAFLTAREGARRMPRNRGGRGGSIVLVSSAASRLGSPFEFIDYAASKGALDTLTLGLAKELGREGVRVNAVRPGLIETEIHAASGDPERVQRLGGNVPLGRPGGAAEVAEAIIWLLSDAASYTSGALLDVAGGR